MKTISEEILGVNDEYINQIGQEMRYISSEMERLAKYRNELSKKIQDRMNYFEPKPLIIPNK